MKPSLYQQDKKLRIGDEYLGEETVKNVEKPIRAYRVLVELEHAGIDMRLAWHKEAFEEKDRLGGRML